MNEAVEAAEFAFELGWKLRGLETALAPRGARAPEGGDPQPPPPPGWQRFTLVHCPVDGYPGFDDPRYDGLKAAPPEGCAVEDFGGSLGLRCDRPGGRLLDAVADLCAEIRTGHGLLMTGLGIEKLWEWSEDGTDGWGAEIVGQLLLMAAERGPRLGYGVDDLTRFLREAAGVAEAGA
ncbi:amidase [Streptomyces xanthophaeus]|uniref:amidase n=1 Tax=Streptomyces xanthophaeus TaxID=67385 RepID=UPI003669D133